MKKFYKDLMCLGIPLVFVLIFGIILLERIEDTELIILALFFVLGSAYCIYSIANSHLNKPIKKNIKSQDNSIKEVIKLENLGIANTPMYKTTVIKADEEFIKLKKTVTKMSKDIKDLKKTIKETNKENL